MNSTPYPTVDVVGVRFARLTEAECVEHLARAAASRTGAWA
jgi:hypothetical protein